MQWVGEYQQYDTEAVYVVGLGPGDEGFELSQIGTGKIMPAPCWRLGNKISVAEDKVVPWASAILCEILKKREILY